MEIEVPMANGMEDLHEKTRTGTKNQGNPLQSIPSGRISRGMRMRRCFRKNLPAGQAKKRAAGTTMTGKNKKRLIAAGIIFFLLAVWTIWSWVPFTERISLGLPDGKGAGIRIVLITDLHSCYYGKNQEWLVKKIESENPDSVFLAGDIFDDKLDDRNAKILIESIVKKYPCWYVTGNHEIWSGRADEMKKWLRDAGVNVLCGDCVTTSINGIEVDVCGVDDPLSMTQDEWKNQLRRAYSKTDSSHLKILVSHRPERVSDYEQYDFDLILTGHAHAGQILIPFLNRGLYAPNQGPMAKYVNGIYRLSNGSTMEVSRGLARESTPLPRFFNHPEIVVLELH